MKMHESDIDNYEKEEKRLRLEREIETLKNSVEADISVSKKDK